VNSCAPSPPPAALRSGGVLVVLVRDDVHARRPGAADALRQRRREPLGDRVRVVEARLAAGDSEAHRRAGRHERLPGELARVPLELVKGARVELLADPRDDAARRAQPEVGAVEVLEAPDERDAARLGARVGDPDRAQLGQRDRLEARRRDREEH